MLQRFSALNSTLPYVLLFLLTSLHVQHGDVTDRGNDFLLIDNRGTTEPLVTPEQAVELCKHNFGVGGDGVIFALPGSNGCDHTMRIYNSDGTEPEMCGNGIRCATSMGAGGEGERVGGEQGIPMANVVMMGGWLTAQTSADACIALQVYGTVCCTARGTDWHYLLDHHPHRGWNHHSGSPRKWSDQS